MKYFFLSHKKGVKNLLNFILLTTLIGGCKSNEPYTYVCKDGLVEYEVINGVKYFQNINEKDSVIFLKIQSQSDYEKYFIETPVKINFKEKTLLATRYLAYSSDYPIKQVIQSDCPADSLSYDIQLTRGGAAASTTVAILVTISKIPNNTLVHHKIHF